MRYSKVFLAIVLMFILVFGSSISAFATWGDNTPLVCLKTSVEPTGGGTISFTPLGGGPNKNWYIGFMQEKVTLTFSASSNYVLDYVTVNGEVKELNSMSPDTLKIKMTEDKNIVAYFKQLHSLSLNSNPSSLGTQSGAGDFLAGAVSQVSTTNDVDGYRFLNWTKDGTEISTALSFEFTMPDGDVALVANYVPEYTLSLSSTDDIVVPTGAGDFLEGDIVPVSTTVVPSYRFINWTNDGTPISTELSFNFTMPDGNVKLMANYVPELSVSVIAVPTEGGVVSGGGTFDEGAEIQVFATPNEHYDFLYWGWDEECVMEFNDQAFSRAFLLLEEVRLGEHNYYTETQNPRFTVYCDTILTAYFQEHPKFKVTTNYIDAASNKLLDSVNDYYYEGQAYTTISKTVEGYVLDETPVNASGTVGEEDIIVNYIFIIPPEPEIVTEIVTEVIIETVTNTVTNTVTETVFVPVLATTEPVVVEDEETPLAAVVFTDIDAFLEPLAATTEAAEEIEVDEEETPLADALPTTGQLPVELFYGAGGLISAVGVMMRRKKK